MRHRLIYSAISFALLANTALADDWKPVLVGPESETYYDASTIRQDGTVVTVRTNTVFKPPLRETGSASLLVQIDCAASKGRRMEMTALSTDGSVIGTQADVEPWMGIVAGTLGDHMKRLVCPAPQPAPVRGPG
jgi:hypothetical protein